MRSTTERSSHAPATNERRRAMQRCTPGASGRALLLALGVSSIAGCGATGGATPATGTPGAGVGAPVRGERERLADSVHLLIETAMLAQSRSRVIEARGLAERALARFPDDPLLLHYRGYALVREAGMAWDTDASEVPPLLREAERALDASAQRQPLAETSALLARIQGYLSALYPRLGADLGAKARGYRADAERLGAHNPRVWLLRAQGSFYTPEVHGGGLARAEEQLLRAVSLFGADPHRPPLPTWGEAEAYAWLGQLYASTNRVQEARAAYQTAMARAPGYLWVRDSLLPRLPR